MALFLFWTSAFIIFYAMIGYPVLMILLDKIFKFKKIVKDIDYLPSVSYMIVAHNEEKVILNKLKNALELDYPKEKLQIIIASDNSSDNTNDIVKSFIKEHSDWNLILYCSKEHKGKTNAQNEAQKVATNEILVMTDANTMVKKDAIKELVSCFTTDDIAYVCGKLSYSNQETNATSDSESTYWNLDMKIRDIESRIRTITAGNGALYACRSSEYIDFDPISCHDSIMPYTYSKNGKRALFNPDAVAVEKAGETYEDEYKRKVRMNRDIFDMIFWGIKVLNPLKYSWFSLFYFGHRTSRYLLWIAHLILFICNLILARDSAIFAFMFGMQALFYVMAIIGRYSSLKIMRLCWYYFMTVIAQWHAVINIITGKAKPTWEKADSTR